jgi:hypothetical protein
MRCIGICRVFGFGRPNRRVDGCCLRYAGPIAEKARYRYSGSASLNRSTPPPDLPCPRPARQSLARHPATAAATPSPHPKAHPSTRRASLSVVGISGIALEWIAPRRRTIIDLADLSLWLEVPVVKLIFAILALAMALIATSVQAQMYDPNYPVCMHVYGQEEGERMDCIFTSLAQCAATASGRAATCLINPYFVDTSGRRRH